MSFPSLWLHSNHSLHIVHEVQNGYLRLFGMLFFTSPFKFYYCLVLSFINGLVFKIRIYVRVFFLFNFFFCLFGIKLYVILLMFLLSLHFVFKSLLHFIHININNLLNFFNVIYAAGHLKRKHKHWFLLIKEKNVLFWLLKIPYLDFNFKQIIYRTIT